MKQDIRAASACIAMVLGTASAWAIDASCVGVQYVAAQRLFDGMDPVRQAEQQPVMDRIRALQENTARLLVEPEREMATIIAGIRNDMPGATDQQVSDALFQRVANLPEIDRAYAHALAVEFMVHHNEALMIANASRLQSGDDGKIVALANRYVETLQTPELANAMRTNRLLERTIGLAAVAHALMDSSMADPDSNRLVSFGAQWGFDRSGKLPAVSVDAIRDVARSLPAALALGTQGELRLIHQVDNFPHTEMRRELLQPGRTQVGRDAARQAARANNDLIIAGEVLKKVARSVPREPPPPPTAPQDDRRAWTKRAADQLREVVKTMTVTIGSSDYQDAAGVGAN